MLKWIIASGSLWETEPYYYRRVNLYSQFTTSGSGTLHWFSSRVRIFYCLLNLRGGGVIVGAANGHIALTRGPKKPGIGRLDC